MTNAKRLLRRAMLSVDDLHMACKYPRATYDTHWGVRAIWWGRFAASGLLAALIGFALSLGVTSQIVLASILRADQLTASDLVGWYLVLACRKFGACGPEALTGGMASVGMVAVSIALLIWFFISGESLRPARVSDDELEELRQLGYIVMEVEDFEHALKQHAADRPGGVDPDGYLLEPAQLDTAGPAYRRTQPTPEGAE